MVARMSNMLKAYLELGSARAIADQIAKDQTDLGSPNGMAAQSACVVLAVEQLETTVKSLDTAATRLQWASIVLAVVAVVLTLVEVL